MIRNYKNAFLRFYRIYTEMALPESNASAYSAIPANIKFLSGSRARVTLAVDVIFLRLGAPKKFRPLRLCPARCICRRQRSRANCLFRHIRKLSFCPLNFTRRGLPRRSISLNPLDYYIINPVKVNIYFLFCHLARLNL